jgi:hypothetical protein
MNFLGQDHAMESRMEVRVARMDTCPKPSHVVGFTIQHPPSQKSLYLDAFVPLDGMPDNATETEIAKKGWAMIKDAANAWLDECEKKSSSLVGSVFEPDA